MNVIDIALGVAIGLMLNRLIVRPGTYFRSDDTDPPKRWSVSGLFVYTDHRTGLQYLSSGMGGLTPQLDEHGNHIKVDQ